jgi:hypothetical protein
MSGMAKQSHFLLLPLLAIMVLIIAVFHRDFLRSIIKPYICLVIGAAVPAGLYLLYLLIDGRLGLFYENVVILPFECDGPGLWFVLFQDHFKAFKTIWTLLIPLALILFLRGRPILSIIAATPFFIWFFDDYFANAYHFVYLLIYFNYLALLVYLIYRFGLEGTTDDHESHHLKYCLLMALIIQYLAGFNNSGILLAASGVGVLIPFSYFSLKRVAAGNSGKIVFAVVFVFILALAGYHKFNYIYGDSPRSQLTSEYTHPRARGIYSTPFNTELLEGLVQNINRYSAPGDYIFTFPYLSGVYYLTGRKNPTPLDWTYGNFSPEMWLAAMAGLETDHPRVIITGSNPVPAELAQFIKDRYIMAERVKGYRVYIQSDSTDIVTIGSNFSQ